MALFLGGGGAHSTTGQWRGGDHASSADHSWGAPNSRACPVPPHPSLPTQGWHLPPQRQCPVCPAWPRCPGAWSLRGSLGPSRRSPAAAPVPGSAHLQPCPPLAPFPRQTPTIPQGKERDLPCWRRRRTVPSCRQRQACLALGGQRCSHFLRVRRASLPALGLFPSRPSPAASPHPAPRPRLPRRGGLPPPETLLPARHWRGTAGSALVGLSSASAPWNRSWCILTLPRGHGSHRSRSTLARAPQEVEKGPPRRGPAPAHGAQGTETSPTHHVHVAVPTLVIGGRKRDEV